MTVMAFRLFQLVISCKPLPAIEKTGQMASRKGSAGTQDKEAKKRDVPAKTGRLATLAQPIVSKYYRKTQQWFNIQRFI